MSAVPPSPFIVLDEMHASNITATFLSSKNVDFEALTAQRAELPMPNHIPKIAHFVFTEVKELTWLQYACIRSAITHLGVEKVKIWIPLDTQALKGDIWPRIERLKGVEIVRVVMPDTVFGKTVQHIEHESDLARLKILYEEGGIYMDTDVLALKSSDEVIYDKKTKATVMPSQNPRYAHLVSNAMIMSKPGSPFLRRWMLRYKDFDLAEWDHTSCRVPMDMADAGDPDLTVLPYESWMYPMTAGGSDVGPDPHLATQWLGKSWYDIDKSYGVHLWKFDGGHMPRPVEVTPETVRTVDTPIFCKMRAMFDDLDDDGYRSIPWQNDPNCWPSYIKDLRQNEFRKFGDWRFDGDDHGMKWIDFSGHRNHGFALLGNNVTNDEDTGASIRRFDEGSHAWLPVPANWDARVGTVRMSLRVDEHAWLVRDSTIGLLKVRNDYGGEIALSLQVNELYDPPLLKFEWHGNFLAHDEYKHLDDVTWITPQGLNLSLTSPNDLAVSYDRRTEGSITVYVNGDRVAKHKTKLVSSPTIGNEVWINAREWKDLDTGFRGNLYGMSMYADVVPDYELMGYGKGKLRLGASYQRHSLTVLYILLLGLVVACWTWRARFLRGLGGASGKAALDLISFSNPSRVRTRSQNRGQFWHFPTPDLTFKDVEDERPAMSKI